MVLPFPKLLSSATSTAAAVEEAAEHESMTRARRAREGARARSSAPPLFITLRAVRSAPASAAGRRPHSGQPAPRRAGRS